MKGVRGKLLEVDLTQGTTQELPVPLEHYHRYLGGRGLGARLLYDMLPPGTDPLSPDNLLFFLTGPLTGSIAVGASKFVVVTKSPLTHTWCDAYSSGRISVQLKKVGYDGMVIRGRASNPCYLRIDEQGVDIRDASHLWGKDSFTTEKTLVGGVIDGHNIWRGDLAAAFDKLGALRAVSPNVAVTTSTSLFHTPHDVEDEPLLGEQLKSWLAFADQKVRQIATLAKGLTDGEASIRAELDAASAALENRRSAAGVRDGDVRARAAGLTADDFSRGDYAARLAAQDASLGLPFLPTTTIGSFPQTGDIRKSRAAFAKGAITEEQYKEAMRAEIRNVVELQEEIGLDVIVHGEPERNDMVQYFAENLDGFAVTQNGWVQSYGSRCTRPSILWGDVSRPAPITVEWSSYTQGLTPKPVKGMLTGPVTILAWSFVRDDQPLGETANQVALALRDEIADLESAGIGIIQVDEPALRELLPLKKKDHADYLDWSVGSFRLATSGVKQETQIHTHLCYSEFGVVIDAINNLDADVTSIEAARSKMEVVPDIQRSGFGRGIGPGVYDIHSPRVPSVGEVTELIEIALGSIPERQVWVNPDCGLKTRGYDETVESLKNVLAATRLVRERAGVTV